MKQLSTQEIQNLKHAVQYFQDCYLVSSIGALAGCRNGQKILRENISHTKDGFCIKFNNINGQIEDFFVTQKEMDNLVYMDKYLNPIPISKYFPHNPVIKAIEAAMNKLLTKYPYKKPWICRIPDCNEKFEFNKPSNFFKMFTGKIPIVLNEGSIKLSLKSKRDTSRMLFDKISEEPDNSFVAGTSFGFGDRISNNHCYSITSIDKASCTIKLFDHRTLETLILTYEEAIRKLKYLVGYFNKDLE